MDKNKIIEAAAKLVAKGAYDKAIKEYQKVLDFDPRDVRVLQKMGELYQKKNDNIQAAYYFTKVAESYSQDGFFLKAVALYKQVLKLNPNLIDVNLKLAELHQQLGLMSEAMAYFQIVANHHDKQGDTKASLDTLKKMVDLDPDNVASRIKLAELYARESMSQEALDEFKRAAEYLKRNNRSDDYIRVAERISSLEPDNLALAKELAQGFLQKGDQKRALAKLQTCFKADPKDLETLTLLAQAFQGLGQTSKTISVYKELAKVYSDRSQASEEQRIWGKIRELDPNDPDLAQRAGPPSRTPAPAAAPSARAPTRSGTPAPVQVPRTATPVPRPVPRSLAAAPPSATMPAAPAAGPGGVPQPARQAPQPAASGGGGGRDQLAKLLTETDVYVKYGLHDKALEHLRKVFSIDPENLDAHEKAYHIYLGSNNQAQAQDQLLNVLRLCTRRREVQRAQPYLATILQQNPGHPEVPAFLAVLRTDATAPVPVSASQGDEEAILVDSNEEEIIVADAPEDALAGAADDLAIRAAGAAGAEEEVVQDDGLMPADETGPGLQSMVDEPISTQDDGAELMMVGEDEEEEPITSSFDLAPARQQQQQQQADPRTLDDTHEELDEEPRTQMAPALSTEPNYQRRSAGGAPANPELTQPHIRVPRPEPKTLTNPRASAVDIAAARQVTLDRTGPNIEGPTRIEAFPMERPGRGPTLQKEAKPAEPPRAPQRPPTRAVARPPEPEELEELDPEPDSQLTPLPEDAGADASLSLTPVPESMSTMEEPAAEECDEAAFFVDQGLWDEAREILETVLVAYPGHARATELLARVEAGQGGMGLGDAGVTNTESDLPAVQPGATEEDTGPKDAFDLAAELADELGGSTGASGGDSLGGDDFQYSVDEVFSEFKKGLEKVVKPEDAETHYDLGIAYKEMGLLDDAIGEMLTAQKGCVGTKKEVDCLMMAGVLHGMKGDHAGAVGRFKEGLSSEHAQPPSESFKALAFELGTTYEALGKPGKALFWFQKIAKADPKYRDISAAVGRLSGSAKPEEDELAAPKKGGGGNGAPPNGTNGVRGKGGSGAPPAAGTSGPKPTDPGKARKVGYV